MARVEGCPAGVVTAKPGRERWAFEEAWDIAVEADPNGRVEETRFRGVYLVYADPLRLARLLLKASPAFIKSFIVSAKCIPLDKGEPDRVLDALKNYADSCAIEARLRGEARILAGILEHSPLQRITGEYTCTVHIEGVDFYLLVAKGVARDCGFGCRLIIDEALEEAIHSL